jgi:hypothetical protein
MTTLLTHATHPHVLVACVGHGGLRRALAPILTTAGSSEFASFLPLVNAVQLSGLTDSRSVTRCAKCSGELDVGALY